MSDYSYLYVLSHIAPSEHGGVRSSVLMQTQHVWKDLILTTLVILEAPGAQVKAFVPIWMEERRESEEEE